MPVLEGERFALVAAQERDLGRLGAADRYGRFHFRRLIDIAAVHRGGDDALPIGDLSERGSADRTHRGRAAGQDGRDVGYAGTYLQRERLRVQGLRPRVHEEDLRRLPGTDENLTRRGRGVAIPTGLVGINRAL